MQRVSNWMFAVWEGFGDVSGGTIFRAIDVGFICLFLHVCCMQCDLVFSFLFRLRVHVLICLQFDKLIGVCEVSLCDGRSFRWMWLCGTIGGVGDHTFCMRV